MARRAGLCGVEPSRTSTARANSAAHITCCNVLLRKKRQQVFSQTGFNATW